MFGPPQKKFLKAAADGDMETLRHCFYYDIPDDYGIGARDPKGKTALHLAAEAGRAEAVAFLLEKKAAVDVPCPEGGTPLFYAVKTGNTGIAKMLIAGGADVNAHSSEYAYPLHWAANNGDIDVVKLLVAGGADINALTKAEERTPLYYAIAQNRGSVAEFLLASGARTDIPGTDGKTDADYAKANNSRIAQMIADAAAKPREPAAAALRDIPAPAAEDGETWKLMGASKAAHIGTYPGLNRRITEIFNFATRERLIITENLKTGAETMGPAEKFDSLSPDAVATASEAFRELGGEATGGQAKKSFNL